MMKHTETPLLTQYREMKKKHPDSVLLFRVGDFYETFCDDAITISQILGITLTRRASGKESYTELSGFPHHALDVYLPKLVRAGKRVAIYEQLQDPKVNAKVNRGEPAPMRDAKPLPAKPHLRQAMLALDAFLAAFLFVMDKLAILDKMMQNTREICRLSRQLPIAPSRAFAECCNAIDYPEQPTLPI